MIRKERAFTLIETLVVIAIIGVMIATSIPIYSELVAQAKLAEASSLLAYTRQAMEVGAGDIEDHGNSSAMIDSLGLGLTDSIYVVFNQESSSNDAIMHALAPGLSLGVIKDPYTHVYMQWQPGCLRENYPDSSCMLYMAAVINCKYAVRHIVIQWHDNQSWEGAVDNSDFFLEYSGRFDRVGESSYGCNGDHLDMQQVSDHFGSLGSHP